VIATSYMVQRCLQVADRLAQEGIQAEIVDPRTLVPFDMATLISSVEKTGRVVIVDETHQSCGVAAEIAARIAESGFDKLKAPLRRVATLDVPVPYSPPLEEYIGPREDRIIDAIRFVLR
jgi:acetoin:2,6-dichlorophenolindophenol oxidoreductase subunit beta